MQSLTLVHVPETQRPTVHRIGSPPGQLLPSLSETQQPIASTAVHAEAAHGVPEQTSTALQTSPVVHVLPSSHGQPAPYDPCSQAPVLHTSSVHGFPSEHARGVPAQTPLVQVSPEVQTKPSLQAPGTGLFTHVVPEQRGEVHTLLSSVQVAQTPLQQSCPAVQRGVWTQVGPTQVAEWHGGALPAHAAASHPPVQPTPAMQVDGAGQLPGAWVQAPARHPSTVHGIRSSQSLAAPRLHVPPRQASPTVQSFPSVQPAALSRV